MAKVKVFQLAKEYNMSSASLLQMLRDLGCELKSHMSTVDDDMQANLKQKFANKREEVKQEFARKSKMVLQQKVDDDLIIAGEERIKKVQPTLTSFEALAGDKPKRKKKKRRQNEADQVKVRENVRKIMAKIGSGDRVRKKYYKEDGKEGDEAEGESKKKLMVSEFVSIAELAKMMELTTGVVMAKCFEMGMMITINQRLDFDTIALIADEYGFEAQLMEEYVTDTISEKETEKTEDLQKRPPVITVMGHVDHGKTSLLDFIRKTNVTSGESGGITQHIGAYVVNTTQGLVTFLDTPGHEAFTSMRARGAQVTDVVVLVVAADSGVMPQTIEAIDHAKAAGVPIIVAVNKIDLPKINVNRVLSQLAEHGVVVEEFGGEAQSVALSARTGENVPKLLELLALEADMLELKANPNAKARGVIIEAELNKGMGPLATVLVQNGTLRVGDSFVVGVYSGRVRTMFNEQGERVAQAGPSVPVRVLGIEGVPQAGDSFTVMEMEREAREIASKRRQAKHEREIRQMKVTLDNWHNQITEGALKELDVIIKGDVDGSVEALSSQIEQLSTAEVKVRVIHRSVGAIKETDIDLAAASKAVIIGFHVHPNSKIREYADNEGVEIRTYRVIYEAVEQIKKAMTGLLAPIEKENILGRAQVRQIFSVSKKGNIAGCSVLSGIIRRDARIRLLRDDVEIVDTKISSLRRVKDDVREVAAGFECGIMLENYNDIKTGDILETYEIEKIARTSL
jgi:translation initiation factor IF-2